MTDEIRYTVLVSTDKGLNWRRHAGIIANTTEQACKRVRDAHYSSGGTDADALFYATQAFRPRKMVPKKVTKLTMQQVELDAEPVAEAPMPHEPQLDPPPPTDPGKPSKYGPGA